MNDNRVTLLVEVNVDGTSTGTMSRDRVVLDVQHVLDTRLKHYHPVVSAGARIMARSALAGEACDVLQRVRDFLVDRPGLATEEMLAAINTVLGEQLVPAGDRRVWECPEDKCRVMIEWTEGGSPTTGTDIALSVQRHYQEYHP